MTTLILVCIFNISPVNTGSIQYIPITAAIAQAAQYQESSTMLRQACSNALGSPIDLAYVLK